MDSASVAVSPTPAKSGLGGKVAWIFAGNTLFAAAQWGMLAILAKKSNTTDVGIFSLGLAVTAPPILFATALRGSQATDVRDQYSVKDYFLARATLLILACFWISIFLATQHYSQQIIAVVIGITVAKIFDSLSDGVYGYLQRYEFMHRISISRIIQGITQVLAVFFVMKYTRNLFYTTVAFAIASGLVTLLYDVPSLAYVSSRVETPQQADGTVKMKAHVVWTLLKMTAPLGLVTMLLPLTTTIPRYVVERDLGPSALGIFSALAYVTVAGSTVVSAVGNATVPRLAHYFSAGDRHRCSQLIKKLILVSGGACLVMLALTATLGPVLIKVLYTASYAKNNNLLLLLVAGAGVSYIGSILGFCMTATRQFSKQVVAFVPALLVSTVLSLWLTKNNGLMGTGVAIIMGWITHLAISGTFVYRSLAALDGIKRHNEGVR